MPKSPKFLFVGSSEAYSGKSAIVLGIAQQLQAKGLDIAYGKPLGTCLTRTQTEVIEEDVLFMANTLNLPKERVLPMLLPLDEITIADYISSGGQLSYQQQLQSYSQFSASDLVVLEGAGTLQEGKNPAAEKLTGYSLTEVRGRPLHDVIHHTRPDGRPYPLEECPIDRAFPQNNQEQGEEVFIHRDGHFYPVAYTASPIRGGNGVVGTIIEVQDISERKRAEAELQRAKERYRAFIQQSSEGIWCFELEQPLPVDWPEDRLISAFYQYGYLAECNQVMAQMYGLASPQDLIGARLGEFLVESDPNNLEYLRTFIRSGYRLTDAESYEVDRQGQPKIFLNNLVGIIENGLLIRAWGTQRDITERKQAEQRLQLFADVVRNTQMGIVVWQLENLEDPASFRLLIANPAASNVTGIEFERLIGTTMGESFPRLLQTELVERYQQVVRTGEALDLGEVPYAQDGIHAGVYNLKAFALPNRCLGLSFENITARKYTESQLQQTQYFNQQIAETVPGILFVYDLTVG
ncbi:PAS domain-containing protein [Leptolyngbya sp. 7M]|uniref:PAS domain-containing protein n=1 Tax=Leptolyngbya sp. 7M TaxID=2812896 RepID=UPI001B8BC30E|nr:PAS domain S-box protein [Leptolyngbya sp. 7M]QYO64686.1 PAS domain S-box protein [Leptolyngbya sp. 7M]